MSLSDVATFCVYVSIRNAGVYLSNKVKSILHTLANELAETRHQYVSCAIGAEAALFSDGSL